MINTDPNRKQTMPDLLLYFKDDQSGFKLEELARSMGYRVKSTIVLQTALEWLKLKEFEVLLVDYNAPIEEQQALGGALWQKNSLAQLICFNLEETSDRRGELGARLLGAKIAFGRNAIATIERYLREDSSSGVGSKIKVLVVDDLDSARDVICSYLKSIGYPEAVGVESVAQALAVLNRDPQEFGCVITDFKMPGLGGHDLTKKIRSDPRLKHLPVVVLTAYGTPDCLMECLKAGASGFLAKPPKKQDLCRELARAAMILNGSAPACLVRPEDIDSVIGLLAERGLP